MEVVKTETMAKAAAMLAQSEFLVYYAGLEPTHVPGRFEFVLEVDTDKEKVDDWEKRYTRQQTTVEPNLYDQKLALLRNDSKREKGQAR